MTEKHEELRSLAVELHEEWCLDGEAGPGPDWHAAESCHGFAGSVLESDWLAAHDDRIRAESGGYMVDAYAEGKGVMRDWLEREIRALHVNNDGPNDWCVGCHDSKDVWPCPTLRILGDKP